MSNHGSRKCWANTNNFILFRTYFNILQENDWWQSYFLSFLWNISTNYFVGLNIQKFIINHIYFNCYRYLSQICNFNDKYINKIFYIEPCHIWITSMWITSTSIEVIPIEKLHIEAKNIDPSTPPPFINTEAKFWRYVF